MRNRTPANSQSYFSILLVYGLIDTRYVVEKINNLKVSRDLL